MTQTPVAARQSGVERFQELMRELLQLDLADLDFGIYKLLNARRAEVDALLGQELPRRVDEAFAGMSDAQRQATAATVGALAERIRQEIDPDAILANGGLAPVMKVIRLEGYDDAPHNIEEIDVVQRTDGLFERAVEDSRALLNVQGLSQPFDDEIEVLTNDGPRKQTVDLVETFNLAYGVHVERIQVWTNEVDARRYRAVSGHKDGHRLLILWRDLVEPPLDPQVERAFLEERIEPGAYEEVLINGDSAVPGVTSLDSIFKRLIEEEDR